MKASQVAKPAQKTYSIKSTTNQIHLLYAENWQEARRKGREWCKENNLKFSSCRLVRKVVESLPLFPEELHQQRKIKKLTSYIGKTVMFEHWVDGKWSGQFWGTLTDVKKGGIGVINVNGVEYLAEQKRIVSSGKTTPTEPLSLENKKLWNPGKFIDNETNQ
jgi:hypothetical protein